MLTMGRKQEARKGKARERAPSSRSLRLLGGYRSLILPSIDRAERPEKEVKLESLMIGGNYLVRFGG